MNDDRLASYLDSIDPETTCYDHESIVDLASRNPRKQGKPTLNTMDKAVVAEYEEWVAEIDTAPEPIALVFNAPAWAWIAMVEWTRQVARGEIPTTPVRGENLRPGDMFAQDRTNKVFRLLEALQPYEFSESATVWRAVSVNTVGRAVSKLVIWDDRMYRVVEGE